MAQLVEFITNNWILAGLFVLVLGIIITGELNLLGSDINSVTAEQAVQLINSNKAVIIDVRPEAEYRAGHIINSLWYAADNLPTVLPSLKKYIKKTIVMVCNDGSGSRTLVSKMLQENKQKYNFAILHGGIVGWKDSNLPLVTTHRK